MGRLHISFPRSVLAVLLFLLAAAGTIPSSAGRLLQNAETIMELIRSDPQFAFLTVLLEEAELNDDLGNGDIAGNSQLTVFGPIDQAFQSVDEEFLTYLLTDVQWNTHLLNLLVYHIVADQVVLNLDETAVNILGEELTLTTSSVDGAVMVNGYAKVVNSLSTMDGVVHAIDSLLDPGWLNKNLRGVVDSDPARLSTLSTLITRSDTVSTVATSSAPYTLFAPTNTAFDQSGLDLVNNLDPSFVEDVLGYHMVPGIYSGGDLTTLGANPLVTMTGDTLMVTTDPVLRTISVNGHLVIQSDLLANNGVVHIVDGVLSTSRPVEIDPDDVEMCEFGKVMEESLGNDLGVQCNCQVVGGATVQLFCTEASGQQCVPKFGVCNDDVDNQRCCSPYRRRCVYGQCRDSSRPERVKIGAAQGGAEGRLQRDRANVDIERKSLP